MDYGVDGRSSSNPESEKLVEQIPKPRRKKLSLTSLKYDEVDTKQKIVQKISDNGSLVLSQIRLNSQGMQITKQTNQEVKIFSIQNSFSGLKNFKNMTLDQFEIIQRLGAGQYGQVNKVLHIPTQEYYALKKINYISDDIQESLLKKELIALVDCDSPHIVTCYGAFYSKGEIFILLEYMDLGSLETIMQRCGKIIESILMIITQQILKGLCYLHDVKKIIHRDIKPHNILINKKGEVKIADFGICSIQNRSSQKWQTFIGTITFMSPERMNGEEYGMDSDIWSLGVMMIQFLTGTLPLEYNSKKMALIEFVLLVKKFKPEDIMQQWECSKYTKEFIVSCLKQQPNERARAQQLLVVVDKYNQDTKAIKFTQKLNMSLFKNWLDMALEDV